MVLNLKLSTLNNTYGYFHDPDLGNDPQYVHHPPLVVLNPQRPIVEMLDTILEDHNVLSAYNAYPGFRLFVVVNRVTFTQCRLLQFDHLTNQPDPTEHRVREQVYQKLWVPSAGCKPG